AGVRAAAGALPTDRAATPGMPGVRCAHQADGHRGVAASQGVTLILRGHPGWRTSVAGTVRAGETAHARAWRGWRCQADRLGARRPQTPARPKRRGVQVGFY